MTKEELVKLGLSEELAVKVADMFKGYIPKTRFDEVNEAKKKAEEDLKGRDKQLDEIKKSAGDNAELKKQIETLQKNNEDAAKTHKAEMESIRRDHILDRELSAAKAKNPKAVKALLDLEKTKLEGESIIGLKEQLEALQKADDSKFMFDTESQQQTTVTGMTPAESGGQTSGTKSVAEQFSAALNG